jgi:hypothetical protein
MFRLTPLSSAVRRPAVAAATTGVCIALAATGIAVAGASAGEPAAAKHSSVATPTTKYAKNVSFTQAAARRQLAERRRHNPDGSGKVHRTGTKLRFHGWAVDPDQTNRRLFVALWHNGHRVALVTTHKRTQHYVIRTHLAYGKNHFRVIARNIGAGTHHANLRQVDLRLKRTWPVRFHGYKRIAAQMFRHHGWGPGQMRSLINLWNRESHWTTTAANPSGAYGIPQALPGSKMSSAGPNWQRNAATQIRWGLGYIDSRYGSPDGAWAHSQATGWY